MKINLPFIIRRAPCIQIIIANCGIEWRCFPKFKRFSGLDIVMSIDQQCWFARCIQSLAIDHRMAGGFEQSRRQPGLGEQLSAASRSMFNMISKLVSGGSDISPAHMRGPVGIGRVYFNLLQRPNALLEVLSFSVILNVNLAIMNLLPFPVLDGGHITMAIGEAIRKKPLQGRILEAFQTCCALLLFGFIIFVTFKDFGDVLLGGGGGKEAKPEEIRWLPPSERGSATN